MASLEEITRRLQLAVGEDSGLEKSLKFNLRGEGVIRIEGGSVTNEDLPADCVITLAKDDFEDLAKGRLDPAAAFMRGRLKISGDMGLAMKLPALISRARGAPGT